MGRLSLAALTAIVLAACASPLEPPPDASVREGLLVLGELAGPSPVEPRVVLIKDRHVTHGAITRSRDVLMRIRRQNRRAVGFLVTKGFVLLGCEAPLGPLPVEGPARAHRESVHAALAENDDLDALTVYQPIRYEIELGDALTVLGVEDPELYGADVERLEEILELRAALARADLDPELRPSLERRELGLRRGIAQQVEARGRRAAENLLELMRERGHERAILLLGGAHAGGALAFLRERQVPALVFECRSYRAEDEP